MGLTKYFQPIVVLSAVVLIMTGCSPSAKKSEEKQADPNVVKPVERPAATQLSPNKASHSEETLLAEKASPGKAAEELPPIVSPVAEFQQPASVPSGEPLPKLTEDLLTRHPAAVAPPTAPPATQPKLAAVNPPIAANPPVINRPSTDPSPVAVVTSPTIEKNTPAMKPISPVAPASPATQSAGTATLRTGKHSGVPFDPVKENGPIFVDWPKPKVALVLTGMEHGYIEPCGCSGLDRMKGGMRRRYAMLEQLRKDGWPVVPLDVGSLARGFGLQAEMKFRMLVEGKEKMGYKAVGFGPDDLRLPAASLVSVAAEVNNKPSMFLSANVGLFSFDAHVTETSRVVVADGRKIGVTAVLGTQYQKEINNSDLEMIDPAVALQKIVPELKQKADYLVLLANTTRAEAVELSKKFPEFNTIVVAEGPETPPAVPETAPNGSTLLITVGNKGMDAIVLGLYDDAKRPFIYQRVPLDSRFDPAPDAKKPPHEMKDLMAAYQEQVKTLGFAGLGLQPTTHPQAETNGKFIGSQKCESCHETAYRIWKKSMHAQAYETLVKLDPARNFDPECVSCHTVGWHPNKYFPYTSGFESISKTPHLAGVGCEDCHGPGEKHAAAEMPGGQVALRDKYRKAVQITKEESKKRQCVTCHDLDNSRDFDFDAYWPLIEHKEKE